MSEDVIGKLTGFTPDASGIDRDEWLFRAGRASVRAPRGWKWTAGVLTVTQAVTLAAWLAFPRPPSPAPVGGPVAVEPPDVPPAGSAYPADPDSYVVLARTFDLDAPPRPTPAGPGRPGTPLTAGSRTVVE